MSLNISISHSRSFEMIPTFEYGVYVSIATMYLVPFLRYSASNNGVTFKYWLRVVQGHLQCYYFFFYLYHLYFISFVFVLRALCKWPSGPVRNFFLIKQWVKMVPFESLGTIFYSHSIVTMALSCIISEIKRDIGRKSRFFHTPCIRHPR